MRLISLNTIRVTKSRRTYMCGERVEKFERKTPIRKLGSILEDHIKMTQKDLNNKGWS
jgi:hypothetical protein